MKKFTLGVSALVFVAVALIAQDRPAQAGVDVASPSDNVPPKKEALTQKIQRYEKAGFKIGVNYTTSDLFVLNPTKSSFETYRSGEQQNTLVK